MIPEIGNWLIWFTKDKEKAKSKYRQLYEELTREEKLSHMTWHAMCELPGGSSRNLTQEEKGNLNILPEGQLGCSEGLAVAIQHIRALPEEVSTFYFHPSG